MITLDYLPNHPEIKLYQDDKMIRINTDTECLGEFIKVYREDIVLDIGTNNGALLLYANMFNPKKLIGIDINKEALKLCKKNMELNGITNYELKEANAMEYVSDEVDVIICNPPYFKTEENNKCKNELLAIAKHESNFTLEGLIKTTYKNLKINGTFYMLFVTSRIVEVMSLLEKNHFTVKEMKFVYDCNKDFSNVFMVKCVKYGNIGTIVQKPVIIKR